MDHLTQLYFKHQGVESILNMLFLVIKPITYTQMGVQTGSDVGLAFGLVIAAGFATVIGSMFAFCATLANKHMLGIAMAFSAGVMIYVSFADIIAIESVVAFEEHLCIITDEMPICTKKQFDMSVAYATFSFFGGVLLMGILDVIVHKILDIFGVQSSGEIEFAGKDVEGGQGLRDGAGKELYQAIISADPRGHSLTKVGLMSGIAVALHNFPEGLATYAGTIADPTAGIGIAFAIALHNIPEGIVVALPVYYLTGSRMKGFLWAFLVGLAEPAGGIVGWLVLSDAGPVLYGVMFGMVGGMMVYVALNELLPTAIAFDQKNMYAMKSFYAGMVVIAASILMFSL